MNYQQALAVGIQAAQAAGELLRKELHRSGGPRGSSQHSPVDEQAEAAIRDLLENAFPSFGLVGEELSDRNQLGSDPEQHLWLIDPNDGTSSFHQGYRGSAVSLALLRQGVPVLGVVYAYGYPTDAGDLIAWAEGSPLYRNGKALQRGPFAQSPSSACTILLPLSAEDQVLSHAQYLSPVRFRTIPSIAYRLALVAVGQGEGTLSLNGPSSWDYAAGHALLRAVGGEVLDATGQPIRYNPDGSSDCKGRCFGGGVRIASWLVQRDWKAVRHASAPAPSPSPFSLCRPTPGRLIDNPTLLSRAYGCLLGQLAGDNLGGLVEFSSAKAISEAYPQGVRLLADGGTWDTLAGQPTDDSELALSLARCLVQERRYDENRVARAYAAWFKSNPFDMGNTTRTAFWAASAHPGSPAAAAMQVASQDSQANGALMRISPLALFGCRAPTEQLVHWARMDALLSHPNVVCQDTNAVFVAALQYALTSQANGAQVADYARAWAQQNGICPTVLSWLVEAQSEPTHSFNQQQGWVRHAFHNAFYQLAHASSLQEALVQTVARGGDTDTNACIAGALVGAVFGIESIPTQWLDRLLTCRPVAGLAGVKKPRPVAYWPVDALLLAEELLLAGQVGA